MADNNLRAEDIDRLGQALLSLTRELWVVKDRVRILEAALVEAGTLAPDTVDRLQPDPRLARNAGSGAGAADQRRAGCPRDAGLARIE